MKSIIESHLLFHVIGYDQRDRSCLDRYFFPGAFQREPQRIRAGLIRADCVKMQAGCAGRGVRLVHEVFPDPEVKVFVFGGKQVVVLPYDRVRLIFPKIAAVLRVFQ